MLCAHGRRRRDGRLVSQRAGTRGATHRPWSGPWRDARVRDPLLVAILGQWDDGHAGGPALLRAFGLTADWRRCRPATPAAACLDELASQQATQHPVEGDGRISTLHHLLALLMPPGRGREGCRGSWGWTSGRWSGARGGAGPGEAEDWRPEEHPLDGWEEFRVTDQQQEVIRGRFHAVNKELGRRGVRFMFGQSLDDPEWSLVRIHPGGSGLEPQVVLDRLLGLTG